MDDINFIKNKSRKNTLNYIQTKSKNHRVLHQIDYIKMNQAKIIAFLSSLLGLKSVLAATEEEKKAYPEYEEILADLGLDWEPHEVKTEDGWYLTLFRVLPPSDLERDPTKLPIYLVHGSLDSGKGFLQGFNPTAGATGANTWTVQMVQRGYEVWLHNSRGVKYSNRHERDGEWSLKERWDFSWAEMGYYDLPVSIDHILNVTQAEKVTVAGHSQGTSQMWYAMSKRQDFFAPRVNRFIALSSCTVPEGYPYMPTDFNNLTRILLRAEQLGIYNLYGGDESSSDLFTLFCKLTNENFWCLSADVGEWLEFTVQAQSLVAF